MSVDLKRKEYLKEYYIKNKKKIQEYSKEYYLENKEHIIEHQKKYDAEHKEHSKEYKRELRKTPEHKKKVKLYLDTPEVRLRNRKNNRIRSKFKYDNDPDYKLKRLLRGRLNHALDDSHVKADNTLELLGCTVKELREHLESKFKPGMTWENHAMKGWHVDHIIPCDSFDFSDPEQQKKCFHYTNLQPLWWDENIKKSNKIL